MAIDYGIDCACVSDLPLRHTLVSGKTNLGQALARRLVTQRGALAIFGENPNYGLDCRRLVLESMTPQLQGRWESDIARECEKDERVLSCACSISFTSTAGTATVTLGITTADAQAPYQFILGVSIATVTLLEAA